MLHEPRRPDPTAPRAEVAALTRRLRELSAQGRDADPAERAAFLADQDALLARITDRHRDPAHRFPPTDDAGAPLHRHQAVTWCPGSADDAPVEMPEWMREQARRTEAQIAAGSGPPSRPDDLDELAARIAALQEQIAARDTDPGTAVHTADAEQDARGAEAARWHHDETTAGHDTADDAAVGGDVDSGPGWSR